MLTANLPRLVVTGLLVGLLLINSCTLAAESSAGCRDNNGASVDWFIVYLLPESVQQMYMDVNNQAWTPSGSIEETGHAIYNTLQQIYSHHTREKLAYILYNDENPVNNKTSSTHGHTKGAIAFDLKSGFWLVHSLPLFPPRAEDGYGFEGNVGKKGQTFLCVTFPYHSFDTIGTQLLYNYPQIYDSSLPEEFNKNKNVAAAIKGEHVRQDAAPWTNKAVMNSLAEQPFTSFAKYSSHSYGYDKDLYDAWVAPALKSSLLVQTWTETDRLPSDCKTRYTVENVEQLELNGETFKTAHVDHSKWAVSAHTDGDWICIGDINRAKSQEHRAGGTVCSELPQVADAFRNVITATESCSGEPHVRAQPHAHAKPAHPKHRDEV